MFSIDEVIAGAGGNVLGKVVTNTFGALWDLLPSSSISHDPIARARNLAARSARFDMLTTWSYDMPDFIQTIRTIIESHNATVRILLLSPTSKFLKARAEALGLDGDVRTHVRSNIEQITQLMRDVPTGRLQAKLYDRLPTVVMFGTDKSVIAAWLLEKLNFRSCPAITLKRNSKAALPLIGHFESIWDNPTSTTLTP
jgi:hypothetical protein